MTVDGVSPRPFSAAAARWWLARGSGMDCPVPSVPTEPAPPPSWSPPSATLPSPRSLSPLCGSARRHHRPPSPLSGAALPARGAPAPPPLSPLPPPADEPVMRRPVRAARPASVPRWPHPAGTAPACPARQLRATPVRQSADRAAPARRSDTDATAGEGGEGQTPDRTGMCRRRGGRVPRAPAETHTTAGASLSVMHRQQPRGLLLWRIFDTARCGWDDGPDQLNHECLTK